MYVLGVKINGDWASFVLCLVPSSKEQKGVITSDLARGDLKIFKSWIKVYEIIGIFVNLRSGRQKQYLIAAMLESVQSMGYIINIWCPDS